VIGTDHAPHSSEKKQCEWQNAAFGMLGLEHAASVLQKILIDEGGRDWGQFASLMSTKSAEIGGLAHFGSLAVGSRANITLLDPSAKREILSQTHSKSSNNPFAGITLPGAIEHTIFNGVFTYRNRKIEELK
jgi:dihydroorotase